MIIINNRDKVVWKEGMVVRELLRTLGYSYSLITVTINDVFVSEDDYDRVLIPDEANVIVFHLAHGG